MSELAYVNGTFCDPADATVSINDRGFQYADSVYEVIVAIGSEPFRMTEHLERMRRGLEAIGLDLEPHGIDLERIIREGIERAGFDRTMVYLQVTRGVQPRAHVYQDGLVPTIVATFRPKPVVDAGVRARGVSIMTIDDTRRTECKIKATSLLPNVLAVSQARRDGYHDAVFVSPSGEVREASSSNVFAVRGGGLVTPVRDASILHGITRQYILECAERMDLPLIEGTLTVPDLESADEVFLSSSVIDILAVTKVNDKTIGTGKPGPLTARLYKTFLKGLPGSA